MTILLERALRRERHAFVMVAFVLAGCTGNTTPTNDASVDAVDAIADAGTDAVTDAPANDAPPPPTCEGTHCHYVRAGASGSGDGSDWTNAFPALPSSLVRGDTYYVAAGTYPAYTFGDAAAAGARITVVRATIADHGSERGWDAAFAAGAAEFAGLVFTTDDYEFDGRTGGGPGAWETGFGFTVRGDWHNIDVMGGIGNIAIRHVDVENAGRYHSNNGNDISVYATGGAHDLTFSHCYFHDVNGTQFVTRGTHDVVVEYSKLARNGPVADMCADGPCHREAWSASTDSDVTVRFNVFEDISNTAFIYLGNSTGVASHWTIHGNVFWSTGRLTDVGVAGLVYVDDRGITVDAWQFHHNVIANVTGTNVVLIAPGATAAQLVSSNNIWFHNTVNAVGLSGGSTDYDLFIGNRRTEGCPTPCDLDAPAAMNEAHGATGTEDPFVASATGDFHLRVATPAGETLPAPFDRDPDGTSRGADGTWDRGAYELR